MIMKMKITQNLQEKYLDWEKEITLFLLELTIYFGYASKSLLMKGQPREFPNNSSVKELDHYLRI